MAMESKNENPRVTVDYDFADGTCRSAKAFCPTTKFIITFNLDSLTETHFHVKFNEYLHKILEKDDNGWIKDVFGTMDGLGRTIGEQCSAIFEMYAITPERYSLEEYLRPLTYRLSLVKDSAAKNGVAAHIVGKAQRSDGWDSAPISVDELDARAASLRRFKASELVVESQNPAWHRVDKVVTADGKPFFYKPHSDMMDPEFNRELFLLLNILDLGLHKTLRVSHLVGLVVRDDGLVAGMLMKWLPALPLADEKVLHDHKSHKGWKEQVVATVNALHEHNIIWGDVNPHNILVDSDGFVWVVDFGGNCNVQFIDEELKETIEGDVQGIRRIFEEWLPSKVT